MIGVEVSDEDATLPRARVRASWWRRLLAWFKPREIRVRCGRCGAPLERDPHDADNHERLCSWFAQAELERISVDEAARRIDAFNERLKASLPVRQTPPVATLLPGPGEPIRMPSAGPGARQSR